MSALGLECQQRADAAHAFALLRVQQAAMKPQRHRLLR